MIKARYLKLSPIGFAIKLWDFECESLGRLLEQKWKGSELEPVNAK